MKSDLKELFQITLIIVLVLIIGFSISFIDSEDLSLNKNCAAYSILFGIAVFFIFWLKFYLKRSVHKNSVEQNLEFFRVLLPTSASILGTIWLFSSGYLNLRAENLQNNIRTYQKNIHVLEKKDSILKIKVSEFIADSTSLFKENNFMKEQITKLEGIVASYPEIEQENALIKVQNDKLLKEIIELESRIELTKPINNPNFREIKHFSYNVNRNSKKLIFHIHNQEGRNLNDTEIELGLYFIDDFEDKPLLEREFRFKTLPVKYIKNKNYFEFVIPQKLLNNKFFPYAEIWFKIKKYKSKNLNYQKFVESTRQNLIIVVEGSEHKIFINN